MSKSPGIPTWNARSGAAVLGAEPLEHRAAVPVGPDVPEVQTLTGEPVTLADREVQLILVVRPGTLPAHLEIRV